MLNAFAQAKACLESSPRDRAHLGDEHRPEYLHVQGKRAFGLAFFVTALALLLAAGVVFRTEMSQTFQTVFFTYRYWYPVAALVDAVIFPHG